MLWNARITLPDRPGALAGLARECGEAGVNILGLQVFPGVELVTDELVLAAPDEWTEVDVADLVERAGARAVSAYRCSEGALVDQPTRYVQAARTILDQPARFPEVVARLFDAAAQPLDGEWAGVMEMSVGDVQVQVHRRAPFTPTEHARGAALAELVSDVRDRARAAASAAGSVAQGQVLAPDYVVGSHEVTAVVSGVVVGRAVLADGMAPGRRRLVLDVDAAWRRRGIGSRLLLAAARLAAGMGEEELVLLTRADNQAVLPLVLASGLRGRIRLAGDELLVRVVLRDLVRA